MITGSITLPPVASARRRRPCCVAWHAVPEQLRSLKLRPALRTSADAVWKQTSALPTLSRHFFVFARDAKSFRYRFSDSWRRGCFYVYSLGSSALLQRTSLQSMARTDHINAVRVYKVIDKGKRKEQMPRNMAKAQFLSNKMTV